MQRLQMTRQSMEKCMQDIDRKDGKEITWIRGQMKVFDVIQRIKRLKLE